MYLPDPPDPLHARITGVNPAWIGKKMGKAGRGSEGYFDNYRTGIMRLRAIPGYDFKDVNLS
jgi:hypothetical protein